MLSDRGVLDIFGKSKSEGNSISSYVQDQSAILDPRMSVSCYGPCGRILEGSNPRPGCPSVSTIPTVTYRDRITTQHVDSLVMMHTV